MESQVTGGAGSTAENGLASTACIPIEDFAVGVGNR